MTYYDYQDEKVMDEKRSKRNENKAIRGAGHATDQLEAALEEFQELLEKAEQQFANDGSAQLFKKMVTAQLEVEAAQDLYEKAKATKERFFKKS